MISLPTFRGVLSGFNPLSLSPALWLNDTGSDPSVWTDMSGNGRNASQSDPAKRPSIVTNALNGKQVRRFDGEDDNLELFSGLNVFQNVPGVTIIIAYKWIAAPSLNKAVFLGSTPTGAARLAIGGGVAPSKVYTGGRRLDSDSFIRVDSTINNPASYFIHSGIIDYANSNLFQYINNVLDGQNTSFQTDGNTSDTASSRIIIGSLVDTGYSNVDIAEILVFQAALSTVNRQRVERYLSGKYAIAF